MVRAILVVTEDLLSIKALRQHQIPNSRNLLFVRILAIRAGFQPKLKILLKVVTFNIALPDQVTEFHTHADDVQNVFSVVGFSRMERL